MIDKLYYHMNENGAVIEHNETLVSVLGDTDDDSDVGPFYSGTLMEYWRYMVKYFDFLLYLKYNRYCLVTKTQSYIR